MSERLQGRDMTLPLDGSIVLEPSPVIAGPYCGGILADHGAECIKIEPPEGADRGRATVPLVSESPETRGFFYTLGRNRKGVAPGHRREARRQSTRGAT
jgi:crotonobetainyl-CoA:carnitine CoA-transferase CaiB-like acyl-CoA transferase